MKHPLFTVWVSIDAAIYRQACSYAPITFLVCEYYAHIECQDFAIADCKENATYVPGKELGSVKHVHHWREGNLPQSSKCAYCKKTCWSSECLTGEFSFMICASKEFWRLWKSCNCWWSKASNYRWNRLEIFFNLSGYRCEWCGFTSHGGCRHYVHQECTFGMLQPIYLPPHAVSIPRTEVPMEAIIGVQVKTKGAPMTREYSCRECPENCVFSYYYCFFFINIYIFFIMCCWPDNSFTSRTSYHKSLW